MAKEIPVSYPIREVTVKVKDLMKCQSAVNKLIEMEIKGGKGARRAAKLVAILQEELKDIEEVRIKLIESHGEEKPDGSHFVDMENEEDRNAYVKALNELMDDEVEVRFRPLRMCDFGDMKVPVLVISGLAVFFDFEEDDIPDKPVPSEAEKLDE